ncbi:hypothetical protein FRC09_019356 [Ceratobasidium sp. 395]|nr:hypothetical protein FRC09_019356 [Ceratobasidium sp. 395]
MTPLIQMRHLSVLENPIAAWSAIDSIGTWLPNLKDLSISLEPLKLPGSSINASRDFVISKLPELTRLNGTEITQRDRLDAELFCLSWISRHETGSEQDITTRHPRWKELSDKYQTTHEAQKPAVQNLESNMISEPTYSRTYRQLTDPRVSCKYYPPARSCIQKPGYNILSTNNELTYTTLNVDKGFYYEVEEVIENLDPSFT